MVDELAHTNIPGSRNAKRWQDVHELLEAGIDVVTTVNVQHLESLNDEVEAITGVRQRETVPDHVVREADQIQLIDLPPAALRRRLAHGNVYRAEQIDASLSSYFRVGNLTALRELALLWLADRVDDALARRPRCFDPMIVAIGRERVVVAIGEPEQGELAQRREVADPEVRGERGVDLLGPVDVAVGEPAAQGRWGQIDELNLVCLADHVLSLIHI